jgi:hypothetical protein
LVGLPEFRYKKEKLLKTKKVTKPTEKLKSELKVIQMVTGTICGALAVLVVVSAYGLVAYAKRTILFIVLISVAIDCSAILTMQFGIMKKNQCRVKI